MEINLVKLELEILMFGMANPRGVIYPTNAECTITCLSDNAECFIAGGIYEKKLEAFLVPKKRN